MGEIWRLTTSDGRFAIKESFERVDGADLDEEAAFQAAARAAGVPAPEVIRTSDGRVLAEHHGHQLRVFGWVDLRDVDRTLDPLSVGRTIAAIHQVPFRGTRATDPWYTDPVGADRWDELVAKLEARRAPFAVAMAAYRDELVALETLMEPAADLRTCHRDLWAENIRATDTDGLCVIDWENCGAADPSQELAGVLFEFCAESPERARAFYRAYIEAGGPGRVERPGHFSMTIAQLGHIGEIGCRTWLDETEPRFEREHAIERVREFTDLVLTRAAIDDLLAWLG